MKVGKYGHEISCGLTKIWQIIEQEFEEPIEWIEPDAWIINGSIYQGLLDGRIDVLNDGMTLTADRWAMFKYVLYCLYGLFRTVC